MAQRRAALAALKAELLIDKGHVDVRKLPRCHLSGETLLTVLNRFLGLKSTKRVSLAVSAEAGLNKE